MLISCHKVLSVHHDLFPEKPKITFFNTIRAHLIRIIPNSLYDNRMTKGPFANRNFVQ